MVPKHRARREGAIISALLIGELTACSNEDAVRCTILGSLRLPPLTATKMRFALSNNRRGLDLPAGRTAHRRNA